MGDNDGAGTMIKLNFTNYLIWKPRMEDLLFWKTYIQYASYWGISVKTTYKYDGD